MSFVPLSLFVKIINSVYSFRHRFSMEITRISQPRGIETLGHTGCKENII